MARTSSGTLRKLPSRITIAGEIGEEAFDKIQPGAPGRREVVVDAWMTVDPTADTFMLMSTVVVDNEVNGQRLGCFPFDLLEETQPLHMGVPLFQSGKSACRPGS